jgi:hypothetical protein
MNVARWIKTIPDIYTKVGRNDIVGLIFPIFESKELNVFLLTHANADSISPKDAEAINMALSSNLTLNTTLSHPRSLEGLMDFTSSVLIVDGTVFDGKRILCMYSNTATICVDYKYFVQITSELPGRIRAVRFTEYSSSDMLSNVDGTTVLDSAKVCAVVEFLLGRQKRMEDKIVELSRENAILTARLDSVQERLGPINEATLRNRMGMKYGPAWAEPRRVSNLMDVVRMVGELMGLTSRRISEGVELIIDQVLLGGFETFGQFDRVTQFHSVLPVCLKYARPAC